MSNAKKMLRGGIKKIISRKNKTTTDILNDYLNY